MVYDFSFKKTSKIIFFCIDDVKSYNSSIPGLFTAGFFGFVNTVGAFGNFGEIFIKVAFLIFRATHL